jgi:hypothetical protein
MTSIAASPSSAGRRASRYPRLRRALLSDMAANVLLALLFLAAAGCWLALIGLAF